MSGSGMGCVLLVDARAGAGRDCGLLRLVGLSGSVASLCCGDLVTLRLRAVRGDLLRGLSALNTGAVSNACCAESAS